MAMIGTILEAISGAVSAIGRRLRGLLGISASACSMHILVVSDQEGPGLDRLIEWYWREAGRRGAPFKYVRHMDERVRPSCIPVAVAFATSTLPEDDGRRAILSYLDLPPDTVLPVELIPLLGIRWLDDTNTRMDVSKSFDQALRLQGIANRVESDEGCRLKVDQFMRDWAESQEPIDGSDLARRLESLLGDRDPSVDPGAPGAPKSEHRGRV